KRLRVYGHPRGLNRLIARIGTEDLQRNIEILRREIFDDCDGQRVDLFTGGAAGAPDADGPVGGPILQQRWQYVFAYRLPEGGIAEETCDINQQVLLEQSLLIRTNLKKLVVLGETILAHQHQAAGHAPAKRLRFVLPQFDPRDGTQQLQDLLERLLVVRRRDAFLQRSNLGTRELYRQPSEFQRKFCRWNNEIDMIGRDGAARHSRLRGRSGALHQRDT